MVTRHFMSRLYTAFYNDTFFYVSLLYYLLHWYLSLLLLQFYISLLPFTFMRFFTTFYSDRSLYYPLQWYVSLLSFTMIHLFITFYGNTSIYYLLQWYVCLCLVSLLPFTVIRLLTAFYSDTSLTVTRLFATFDSDTSLIVTCLFATFYSDTSLYHLLQWCVSSPSFTVIRLFLSSSLYCHLQCLVNTLRCLWPRTRYHLLVLGWCVAWCLIFSVPFTVLDWYN